MKLAFLALSLTALLSLGCGFGWLAHPVDSIAQSKGKISKAPEVFIHLGQASQICSREDGTAEVDIFVSLINLPPQEVIFKLSTGNEIHLFGDAPHLIIAKAGVGWHEVEILVPGYRQEPYVARWSVWRCPGFGGDPLRKKDGTLKGYEEEK